MHTKKVRKLVLDFIKRHKLAVISTASNDGKPEAAVLEFGETEDLELIFDTLVTSRKYRNLQSNANVAFVIGWDEEITVQYEGRAHELARKELERYAEYYFAKNPKARKWKDNPDIRYFRVTPIWIRYSNLGIKPWEIHELDLSD